MTRDYELMYIVRPDLDDDGVRGAVESVDRLITGLGGETVKTSMWGKRRLAYEVGHLRDGHYVLSNVRLDGARVAELRRALAIHDTVFRNLLVLQEGEVAADSEEEGETPAGDSATPAAEPAAAAPTAAAEASAEEENDADEEEPEAVAAGIEGGAADEEGE